MNYKNHIESCIEYANLLVSKLPMEILNIQGMSSYKVRHLLNNICRIPNCNYVEVGTYEGSTFCSSIYQNNINATCIDVWHREQGSLSKSKFFDNISKLILKNDQMQSTYKIIDKDYFSLDLSEISNHGTIDIFFYDGPHSKEDTEKAIIKFWPLLKDTSILIIDDWDDIDVHAGGILALDIFKKDIIQTWQLPGDPNRAFNHHSQWWWNGILICLINKA